MGPSEVPYRFRSRFIANTDRPTPRQRHKRWRIRAADYCECARAPQTEIGRHTARNEYWAQEGEDRQMIISNTLALDYW